MRLHPDRLEDPVRTAAAGHLQQGVGDVVDRVEIDGLDPVLLGQGQPFGHPVDPDHPEAAVAADPGPELADRAETEDRERAALRHVGVRDPLPGGRQDVGEVEDPLVGYVVGHLDRAELGLRDAEVLGLAAGHRAVELGVAEQGGAAALAAHLGGLALGEQPALAHPAVPAGDVERDDDAVAGLDVADLGPTSSTVPMVSWPRTSPGLRNGPRTE